ncbi:TIGR00730 family Rossman fold protein, partial [Candidatus Curtissbacteria bacterium]|nr:TIGR00730 family Rossman fold protein [Candidatus Curtissbacteria bacterium]
DVADKYVDAAREFAQLFAENDFDLVWGGTDRGLMKVVADSVKARGGKIYGITMKLLEDRSRQDADEMLVAGDIGIRKALMLEKADALAVLVGGLGTLDELMGVLELKKHKVHQKPIVVLNTDNFYKGLMMQLEEMSEKGFIASNLGDMVYFANSAKDAVSYLNRALKPYKSHT